MVLSRRANFFLVGKRWFVGRKTNFFPRENQKKFFRETRETIRPDSKKMFFGFSLGKIEFSRRNQPWCVPRPSRKILRDLGLGMMVKDMLMLQMKVGAHE